jgi:hypothetical protein
MRAFNELELAPRHHPVLRPHPVQIERELQVLSQVMDNQFRIPILEWRFGLNAIIDLIPEFGDIATTIVALYILVAAVRYRVPKITLLRMGMNIGIDYLVGSLPVIGDVADAWWKSNHMNLELLKKRATVSVEEARSGRMSDWLFVGGIILGLVALGVGSAIVSLYVLFRVGQLLAGR